MSTIEGFEFSDVNKAGFERFNRDHDGLGNVILQGIAKDPKVSTAAAVLFKMPLPRAYNFLMTVKLKYGGGQVEGVVTIEDDNQPIIEDEAKDEVKDEVEDEVKDNSDVNVIVIEDSPTGLRSFEALNAFNAISASKLVRRNFEPLDYLAIKDKVCVVRETLQTLYHSRKNIGTAEVSYDKNAYSVYIGKQRIYVSYLAVKDNESTITVVIIQKGRRYFAFSEYDFGEFVKSKVTGVKKGSSLIKISDGVGVQLIQAMAQHTPTFTKDLTRTF